MKKVIINADDFGYSSGVNQGIIKANRDGILTSTTLMANMPGALEAAELSKINKNLGVGCHLVLTCGRPLTNGKSIKGNNGKFFGLNEYKIYREKMDDEEIFLEWCQQIERLKELGVNLTHIDSHHHVHTFQENLSITKKISDKYKLPFRNAYHLEDNCDLQYQINAKGFLDLMNYTHIRDLSQSLEENKEKCLEELSNVLNQIKDNEITELMVHPAFVDEELYFNSSFNIGRVKEVSILCDQDIKELFNKYQIKLFNYGNIKYGTQKY